MADENLQYTVTFKTRAEGTGAQDARRSVRELADETERLNRLSTPEKIGFTETAYYDLQAAVDAADKKVKAHTETTNTATKSGKNFGAAIGQAGFQVQDFAVQVGAGQNAMVAFAQQGSQLLGMFGPGGAVAGALLAVGAIAYNVFKGMGDDVQGILPQGDALKNLLDDIAKNAEAASDEDIDFAIEAMRSATQEAANLRDRWRETNAAADAYEATQLENQEKIRQAFVEFRRMRGERIDELAEIAAQEKATADRRLLEAKQQSEAAAKRRSDAEDAVKLAQDELVRAANLSAEKQQQLEIERQKRDEMKAQLDLLEQQSKQTLGFWGAVAEGGMPWSKTPAAEAASKKLADPVMAAELAATNGRIADLDAKLQAQGEVTAQVIAAAERASDVAVKLADIFQAVDTDTARIQETLQAGDIAGKVSEAAKVAEATAAEIKNALPAVETSNEEQRLAKESLLKLVADGKLTVNETAQAIRDLQTLARGNEGLLQNVISMVTTSQAVQARQDREISDLKKRFEGLLNGIK
jgi:hypothetical protein